MTMEKKKDIEEIRFAQLLEQVVNEMDDWLIISNTHREIVYANERVYTTCGIEKEKVLGQDLCIFLGMNLKEDHTFQKMQSQINKGERLKFVTKKSLKDHENVYLTHIMTTSWHENQLEYYICISKDNTRTEKLKEEIYKANYFDELTHYPNQKVFLESIYKQIKIAKISASIFSILLIDIKKIGEINNAYGVSVGDHIIKKVGSRIKEKLNRNQEIFKYSGNVFAIIHRHIQSQEDTEAFLKKLYRIMEKPIRIHNSYIYVEFKIGVSVYPKDSINHQELVKMAQIALVKAKTEKYHMPYIFYTQGIQEEIKNALLLEKEMQKAVQNDEFVVYYQPFVNLENKRIVGMEALLRRHKGNGEITYPGSFISILEKMNLIEKVGTTVIEKVCKQIREWIDLGYEAVPVSVNLSALQFKNNNLAKNIKEILERYNVDPKYVVLEITESIVMEDIIVAQLIINNLREYGFSIAIDDFGTGYASIGYLKKFMFDHLKIDISFIREIANNAEDRSIVEAIIAIAKTLKLSTIAEGIENEEQLCIMNDLGCEMGQGFLWDRPISGDAIADKYFKLCV